MGVLTEIFQPGPQRDGYRIDYVIESSGDDGRSMLTKSTVDTAAQRAATSPKNRLPEPSEAQKKAGNYRKGRCEISGLRISVENPAGSVRSGVDADGKEWSVKMKSHYGYVRGTVGFDKDHFDVFIRPGTKPDYDGPVFVVSQANADGTFDEHKAVIGVSTEEAARKEYLRNYDAGWESRILSIRELPFAAFVSWIHDTGETGPQGGHVLKSLFKKASDGNCRWVTLENDVRVCIDNFGEVQAGPKALTGKPITGGKKKTEAPAEKQEQPTGVAGLRAAQIEDMKQAAQYAKDVLTFNLRSDDLIVEAIKRQKDSGKAVLQDIGYAIEYAADVVTLKPTRGVVQEVAAKFQRGKEAQRQGNDFVEAIRQSAVGQLLRLVSLPVTAAYDAMTGESDD